MGIVRGAALSFLLNFGVMGEVRSFSNEEPLRTTMVDRGCYS